MRGHTFCCLLGRCGGLHSHCVCIYIYGHIYIYGPSCTESALPLLSSMHLRRACVLQAMSVLFSFSVFWYAWLASLPKDCCWAPGRHVRSLVRAMGQPVPVRAGRVVRLLLMQRAGTPCCVQTVYLLSCGHALPCSQGSSCRCLFHRQAHRHGLFSELRTRWRCLCPTLQGEFYATVSVHGLCTHARARHTSGRAAGHSWLAHRAQGQERARGVISGWAGGWGFRLPHAALRHAGHSVFEQWGTVCIAFSPSGVWREPSGAPMEGCHLMVAVCCSIHLWVCVVSAARCMRSCSQ